MGHDLYDPAKCTTGPFTFIIIASLQIKYAETL